MIRNVFAWSYQGLGEPPRRLFRLLGLHDGPDITATAAPRWLVWPKRIARASCGFW